METGTGTRMIMVPKAGLYRVALLNPPFAETSLVYTRPFNFLRPRFVFNIT